MKAAKPLTIGVGLVTRVDDGAAGDRGARHHVDDMVGALTQVVLHAALAAMDLAGARESLTADEERNQRADQPGERRLTRHKVVLVTAVGVAGGVRVVLERLDSPDDPVGPESPISPRHEVLDESLARPVVGHEFDEVVAFRRGVLGVEARIDVQPRAVLQEDIRIPRTGDESLE